ncbi:lipocalin family protein [Candidatus Neomarinimicrobiota bacterium]
MKIALIFTGFLFIGVVSAVGKDIYSKTTHIPLVPELDLNRYVGTWYEIARFPHRFERDLTRVTATYALRDDGKVDVINRGFKAGDPDRMSEAKGKAWVPDPDVPARLKVSFFWPFAGDYRVIALDKDYHYAMVISSSWKYFWILCRQPTMADETYHRLVDMAAAYGFNTDKIIKVPQDN